MRVLIDNCIPWRFAGYISGHTVDTVLKLGWANLGDGVLLDTMGSSYDAPVTVDQSIRYQQRIDIRAFGLVVLKAKSNKIADLRLFVPELLAALPLIKPGEVRELS